MKWIIVAGSGDTRKTFTLSEVVVSLVRVHGATLLSPATLPVLHPPVAPNVYPFYVDGEYELVWKNKKIVVKTDGDFPAALKDGIVLAQKHSAEVLISASRARSGSGHIAYIDSVVTSGVADVFVVAALDHSTGASPMVVANRVNQILMLI